MKHLIKQLIKKLQVPWNSCPVMAPAHPGMADLDLPNRVGQLPGFVVATSKEWTTLSLALSDGRQERGTLSLPQPSLGATPPTLPWLDLWSCEAICDH